MLWNSTSDELLTIPAPVSDDWRGWLTRDVDGFGLPLIATLLGMHSYSDDDPHSSAISESLQKG